MFEHVVIDPQGPKNPHVKAVGDLDGDGDDELVVASSAGGPLVWYDLDTLDKHVICPSGEWSCDARVTDLNGDGRPDVLISEWYGQNRIEWFENPGPGGGQWRRHVVGPPRAHDIALGDLDGDGRQEIVQRDQGKAGNQFIVWRRTDEGWSSCAFECPTGEGLAVGDVDGDGLDEVVIGGRWYDAPGGRFEDGWREYVFCDWPPDAVVLLADVNGDGRLEVVLSRSEGEGALAWFERLPDPTALWTEHLVDGSVDYAHSLAAADLDGDGALDIVTAEMHQSRRRRVLIYLNRDGGRAWERLQVADTGSHKLCVARVGGRHVLAGANWRGPYQPVEMWKVNL